MPTPKCCICVLPLGGNDCDTTTGIAELNYVPSCSITNVTFNEVGDDPTPACCPEGEIATVTLDIADPLAPLPEELFQPITYVQQDDDSGAVFTIDSIVDTGNKQNNRTVTFQVAGNGAEIECILDSWLNREVCFHVKFKDGQHKLVNWSGGMRVTNYQKDSNTSYYTVTMQGRPNDRDLFIDKTWADTNLVPFSTNPNGLINQ